MTNSKPKNGKVDIQLIDFNIVEIVIKDNVTLEEKDYWEIKEEALSLTNGQPYAQLIEIGMFAKASEGFKELTTQKKASPDSIARAVLIKPKTIGHLIGIKFYIRIFKPQIPTKIFKERDLAIEWLKKKVLE